VPEPAAPPDGTLGPNDYKFIYDLLTSSDASQRQQGQQFASKLRPDEAQKFFEFQHAVNQPDPNASPDRDMVKAFGIGISPEMALGAGQAGRAIVGAVRGTGAVAGAVEAAAQLAPTVKYELAKTALTSMGVPTPLAVLAAQAISLYRGGGPTTKAATTTSEAGTANTINSRASGTGMTPGEAPPVTATPTGFTMVRPTPNAAPPSAPPTGPVAAPAPAPAAPVRQTPPPVEPPPAASAPVQSAPPPAPAPQASPAPTALSGAAAQGALVQAAARAKVSLTKAELDAMVPHVVAGHPPDQVVEALVALRQAPAAAAPVAEPVAPRPAQVEVEGNIPASKSRRGVPSATPGLTVADVEDLGLNPALKIKKLTPDMMARVMRNRAQRAALYRSDAAFAKSTNAMSQRD
jgi:hypothetical protein